MNSKLLKRLKMITIIFILILASELSYVIYSVCFKNTVSLYFDSINAYDVNSSYYVAVGSNNDNSNYYEKAKITKYNKNYEKSFEKLYNVGFNSVFFNICIDGDELIAVGSYEKNMKEHKNSIRRAIIVKYDSDGEIVFDKDYKVLDNSRFTGIVRVDDGYIVTGQSIYKNTKVGNGDGGAILVKYDMDGNLVWSRTYGSNKIASYNDLLIKDNYIYAVGLYSENVGVISKYDMDGNLVSFTKYDNTDEIGFNDIISVDDKLYVSGTNNTNAVIVEYSLDCELINHVVYDEVDNVRYNKMIVDKDSNIVVIGTIVKNRKSNNNKTADSFNYDGIISKYKANLEKISSVTYNEEGDDYFTDIKYVNNSYLVSGYSSYEDGSYIGKFIRYSDALKVLEVN